VEDAADGEEGIRFIREFKSMDGEEETLTRGKKTLREEGGGGEGGDEVRLLQHSDASVLPALAGAQTLRFFLSVFLF